MPERSNRKFSLKLSAHRLTHKDEFSELIWSERGRRKDSRGESHTPPTFADFHSVETPFWAESAHFSRYLRSIRTFACVRSSAFSVKSAAFGMWHEVCEFARRISGRISAN